MAMLLRRTFQMMVLCRLLRRLVLLPAGVTLIVGWWGVWPEMLLCHEMQTSSSVPMRYSAVCDCLHAGWLLVGKTELYSSQIAVCIPLFAISFMIFLSEFYCSVLPLSILGWWASKDARKSHETSSVFVTEFSCMLYGTSIMCSVVL